MGNGVFLSHNSKDKSFARKLAADLKARGIRAWIDEAELRAGDSLIGRLEAAIDDLDYLAVILSPHSVGSEWVLKEVRMAMHREIAGKRVVVLPLLYTDCDVPGFLRDKIYVDFQYEDNYHQGLQDIVTRVEHDQSTDSQFAEVEAWLDDVPLTKLWKTAIRTRKFSRRFTGVLHDVLVDISTREWMPAVAGSYLFFLMQLLQRGPFNSESWCLLCELVENDQINIGLRFKTLENLLQGAPSVIERKVGKPPELFQADGTEDSVISACVDGLFDPTKAKSITGDPGTPPRMLSELWSIYGRTDRQRLLAVLERYVHDAGAADSDILNPLRAQINIPKLQSVEVTFFAIRKAWASAERVDESVNLKHRAAKVVKTLLSHKSAFSDIEEVVELYRQASALEQSRDFSLYVLMLDLLGRDEIEVLRQLHGDEFTFELLASVVADPQVEVTISVIALTCLLSAFGRDALWIDDRFPTALLISKKQGQARLSVVEGLCESSLLDEAEDDGTSTLLLLWVLSAVEGHAWKRFISTIKRYAKTNERGNVLLSYIDGDCSYEELCVKFGIEHLQEG